MDVVLPGHGAEFALGEEPGERDRASDILDRIRVVVRGTSASRARCS